ncbi:c-type cytochrome biogenesis protein CcmI [Haliea sp. E17]|uniref:c-type cytochrome biogenesis protein CcmI n=1 Tax=Haliea sp. E17 TaxID=3401576 RepID=UPI003AADECC0
MSGFYIACGLLLALCAVFLLVPMAGRHASGDSRDASRQWYHLRRRELEGDTDAALVEDIKLRLLEDAEQGGAADSSGATLAVSRFRAWLLLPLVALFSGLLYFALGAAPDVRIAQQLNSLDEQSSPAQLDSLMDAIERRAEQRPDNLEYAMLLGRFAMQDQDYARAARYFDALSEAAPGDAMVQAFAAQASYLAAGRQLSDTARLQAERALSINPHQRTALGLLGMASFEQEQYRAAITYWERLLAVEPPGSPNHQMISEVIGTARARLGEPVAEAAPADAVAAAETSAGVTVQVNLPAGASVNPAATVFVLARDGAGNSRMPIAVQRLTAGQLPLTLRLDDGNSMAGQKISSFASVLVEVQVSPDGTPGAAKASWLGQAGPLVPDDSGVPVAITLQPNPQS